MACVLHNPNHRLLKLILTILLSSYCNLIFAGNRHAREIYSYSQRPIKDSIDLATYSNKVMQCCQDGQNYGKKYRKCDDMDKIDESMYTHTLQSCNVARAECCQREVRGYNCGRGVRSSQMLISCNINDVTKFQMATQTCADTLERTCCSCCWIGLKVHHEMEQEILKDVALYASKTQKTNHCELLADTLSGYCREAFLKCCQEGPTRKSISSWDPNGDIRALASKESRRMMSCKTGFTRNQGTSECEDINECAFNPCRTGYACINLIGSFVCQRVVTCGTGYYLASDNTCMDINECETGKNPCPQNTNCVNKPGTYKCEPKQCRPGFETDAVGSCTDIDECKTGKHNCPKDSHCENQDGGFTCRCKKGWRYDLRTNTCAEINECREQTHNCPKVTHVCRNRPGTFVCLKRRRRCRKGMQPDRYNRKCTDINECLDPKLNTCDEKTEKCKNIMGSFMCEKLITCPTGTYLNPVENVCVDIDECRRRQANCAAGQRCVNTFGGFECVTDSCQPGFKHEDVNSDNYKCVDIDECSENVVNPCGVGNTCRNLRGSYVCTCQSGYQFNRDQGTCVDIDECSSSDLNVCDFNCINKEGSYECTCPEGYLMKDPTGRGPCVDVDECWKDMKSTEICGEQACYNTQGSHDCRDLSCPSGYEKVALR